MNKMKPKAIKPGRRAYSVGEIVENIKRFLKAHSSGKIVMRVHNGQVVHIDMLGAVDVTLNGQPTINLAKALEPGQRVYSVDDITKNLKCFLKENSFGTIEMRVLCHQIIEVDMWGAMDVIRNLQPNVNQSR